MRRLRRESATALVLTLAACATAGPQPESAGGPLAEILGSQPGLRRVLRSAPRHRVQILLGLLEPGAGGRPTLVQHGYRLGAEYFYPASTVKLLAAVAALERLEELRRATGLAIHEETALVFHPLFADDALEDADPSNLDGGRITVGHEIRKLFLVSDNAAFNRLYELAGQDGLAATMAHAGLTDSRIVHRLSEPRSAEENRRAPRIDLDGAGFRHTIPERTAPPSADLPPVAGLLVGRAHIAGDERVGRPMDFSVKNYVPLAELQRGLCMVVRPDADCGGAGFRLSDADRELLLAAMSEYPRQSLNPVYDPIEFPDDYVKYLLPGLERVVAKERLEISNKIGQAYGFTTENAWVVDRETGRGFFLAATLYTNRDGVLNDDRYEYREVALPFLADLGEAVARHFWGEPDA